MEFQHAKLAQGRWSELSLAEQLGNVGSEVDRALNWQKKNEIKFQHCAKRALELLDFTIQDPRWKNRLQEIVRAREILGAVLREGEAYHTSLEDLNKYFFSFALLARIQK